MAMSSHPACSAHLRPPRPAGQSIGKAFEEVAATNPDRLAVRTAERSLTYSQLNGCANRVARHLRAASSSPDAVAVLIGQSTSMTITMLGVFKAGKIFVPVDVRQPPARMRQILDDCQARIIVTDNANLPTASALLQPGVDLINVDDVDDTAAGTNLDLGVRGDALACVIYTSGSTGSPKGVVQTHESLLHRTNAFADALEVTREDRLSLLAMCSVAQGVSGTLQALLNGASLHPCDLRELGVNELAAWMKSHAITVLVCTPSTFRHFVKTLTPDDHFPHLRLIRFGSEQVLPNDFELYRQSFDRRCVLIGTLGSTEAGPIAIYRMDHDSAITDVVPAGYPLDGTVVKILDDNGQVCAAGEPGELVVHNRSMFHSYWGHSDLTSAAFVDVPNERVKFYRTGDIARMRPDGCIEFLGRKNLRIKIRGFRVELEEIERALSAYPPVFEAAVVADTDRAGSVTLAAYVVPHAEFAVSADELRTHLRTVLPEHMVPATFELVSRLPRTASGKVHRASLPARAAASVPAVSPAPRDAVEMCLINLWEELFDRRPIGVNEDFFALGGHSLLAARLSASIEQALGVKLPLATFITAATIARQAELIRTRRGHAAWASLVPMRTSGSNPPLFLIHPLYGNVLCYRDLVRYLPADQPVYGLQSRGLDGTSRLHTHIEDMARHYVREITKAFPRGPYAIGGWSFGGIVALEVTRQLRREGRAVAVLAIFDAHARPLRRLISRAPIFLKTLRGERSRLAYLSSRLPVARRRLHWALWRALLMWYRWGGWVPRGLRNVKAFNRSARLDYVPKSCGSHVALFRVQHENERLDPTMGWAPLATSLENHVIPGTHNDLVFEPHVQVLAGMLAASLDEAWKRVKASAKSLRSGHSGRAA
jgi:amino acid adenylation domain-containing protein